MLGLREQRGQILAGDEIETTFGGRLGLSTLAAAGLGNLLSDLVGLAMAEPIQARSHMTCVPEDPVISCLDEWHAPQ